VADAPLNDRRQRAEKARGRANEARDRANERVTEARDRANERVTEARDRAGERVTEVRGRAGERVTEVRGRANVRVNDAKTRARDLRARTMARLFGLDRSGPPPLPTQAGQPLNPWTIPNAIGYVRLALIPVFLVVAFSSRDGKGALAVILFALIGWSDYLDGFAARLTGQFSRLGTLLDPITDRCLVISGMAVCWRFSLLPHWALWVVIGREMFMLCLARYAIHRQAEIKINWPGRLAVAPILAAPFFAMAGVRWPADVLLYIGMTLALLGTAMYVHVGFRDYGRKGSIKPSS
jgi:cardiolipin synthase